MTEQNQAFKKRRLKVAEKWGYRNKHWQYRFMPWISISGKWLEQAGFKNGDNVEITVKYGQLIVTKIEEIKPVDKKRYVKRFTQKRFRVEDG
ncbi:formylmethanofuran dehydrogenase subunit D [Filimonas zeae]|uniref:Toxin SymE-like domain-containing protein n=1 Tax=Filimonas zeae TaxID=1737353 RepID=A0A917IRM1_9BACT|nr:SymE family type I addiction module toxin [Filimonas zeae]MDR6337653.1 formylmethanofuran dehydrogenase subunit D [Filimonas zeae]GGH59646.1 hypothetical protein GCM10011379_06650 [Filimonas zeae]